MSSFHFNTNREFQTFREQLRGVGSAELKNVGRGLYVNTGQAPIGFSIDQQQFLRVQSYLLALSEFGPRVIVSELNRMAFNWLREIVHHCPVDIGLARQSFNIAPANLGQGVNVEAAVGSNVFYLVYLEFGTRYIARGEVEAWVPGQTPIL